MLFSVDRIIGKTAVLIGEDQKPLEVPLSMLPKGVKPGEMLYYENNEFQYAPEKTKERRETIAGVLSQLLAHGDDGKDK
ncbi:DUF3006 domain-containing protein [Ruminococcaceae bacterium OttesenSCG-928-I18]|nr:DUF3006 domain-containing protein [Ruminococcaceae bacterium OttesenSCG-928-I18]